MRKIAVARGLEVQRWYLDDGEVAIDSIHLEQQIEPWAMNAGSIELVRHPSAAV